MEKGWFVLKSETKEQLRRLCDGNLICSYSRSPDDSPNQAKYEPNNLEIEYIMELHYIEKLHFYCIRQISALGQNGLLLANT